MLKIIRASALALSVLLLVAAPAFAQATFTWPAGSTLPTDLGQILSNALILIFFFAGLLALIFIVIGGIQWITAGGDKMAAQSARDRITAAVVGLVIVVASFAITLIITGVFGINLFQEGGIDLPGLDNIFTPQPPPPGGSGSGTNI